MVSAERVVSAPSRVRLAVRAALADLRAGSLVAVAVSGGRDSLALLGATVAVAPALGLRVAVATVDHGWHPGSRAVADAVVAAGSRAGVECAEVLPVVPGVPTAAEGPEARARAARYAALDDVARRWSVQTVLLGHTLDDQAESVLIGLSRGSGARSLAGMARQRGPYRRPLLAMRRDVVHEALPGLVAAVMPTGLPAGLPWDDPANADPAMLRPRVRHELMPVLQRVLGPGAVEALARTAGLLRDDADALDDIAAAAVAAAAAIDAAAADAAAAGPGALDLASLAALPVAVRARVLRLAAAAAGAGALSASHTAALADLAAAAPGSGAGPVALPGGVGAYRGHGRLSFGPAAPASGDDEER